MKISQKLLSVLKKLVSRTSYNNTVTLDSTSTYAYTDQNVHITVHHEDLGERLSISGDTLPNIIVCARTIKNAIISATEEVITISDNRCTAKISRIMDNEAALCGIRPECTYAQDYCCFNEIHTTDVTGIYRVLPYKTYQYEHIRILDNELHVRGGKAEKHDLYWSLSNTCPELDINIKAIMSIRSLLKQSKSVIMRVFKHHKHDFHILRLDINLHGYDLEIIIPLHQKTLKQLEEEKEKGRKVFSYYQAVRPCIYNEQLVPSTSETIIFKTGSTLDAIGIIEANKYIDIDKQQAAFKEARTANSIMRIYRT